MHLAFVIDPVRTGVLDVERMWQINVAGTARVMEAIAEVNRHGGRVEKFVFISSVSAYGPETPGPVETLAVKLRHHFTGLDISLDERFDDAGLVVNATSLGLHATDPLPMDPAKLSTDCAVFDIIAARRTEFMQASAARGLRVVDGVAMIRHQLPLQTAFWRGEA